jgi:hypothetical protein
MSINNVLSFPTEIATALVFKKACTEEEKQEIYISRMNICQENFPYILDHKNIYPAKDEFDDFSTLFYVKAENKIVASCRITPFHNGKWEISRNLPDNISFKFNNEITVQLNRVYIEKDFRNENLHEFMFYHFSEWVLANTHYKKYFAICNAGLVRLYKRVGAVLERDHGFYLRGRGDHLYYCVKGGIKEFNAIIKLNKLKNDTNI